MSQTQGLKTRIKISPNHCLLSLLLLLGLSQNAHSGWFDEKAEPTAKITTHFIDMRTGPGRSYPIFYIAEKNEQLTILKERTGWYKVENNKGKQGWVSTAQMSTTLDYLGQPQDIPQTDITGYHQRSGEIGIMLGTFGKNDSYSAYYAYHLNANLSVEIEAGQSFGNISDGQAYSLSVVHQAFPQWRVSPFFTLGGGLRITTPKSGIVATENRKNNTAIVGLGLRTYLSNRLLLRAQYKKHTVLTNRDDDELVDEWKIGISAFF